MRPISVVQKFKETANAHEQTRKPSIDISLTETPTPHYPRRVGKTNDGRNREIPKILECMIFSV